MHRVKEIMTKIIEEQPEDALYEEIMRELAFERMIERGLKDSQSGNLITNKDMERHIQKKRKINIRKNNKCLK